jgi:hypothetical protein
MKRTLVMMMIGIMMLSGCASRSDVRLARDEAKQAQATADRALSVAESARATAQSANARSEHTEQMLNRVFKKSMRK